MAKVEVVRCDFCGTEKGDTNHWYKVGSSLDVILISRYEGPVEGKDACGQACVVTAISRFMDHGDFTDGTVR